MKKTIIALAVASAVAAPMTVNAAGKVYAQVQSEISNSDAGTQMIDNARGRLGYKTSVDIGNGSAMIGKMEFKMDTADGDSKGDAALTKREMFVGMKQGWGTIMMGRVKSPYKYLGGVKYDPFVTTTLQSRGVTMSGGVGQGKAQGHNSFMSDTVALRMGKFQVNIGVDDSGSAGDLTLGYKHKMGKNEIIVAHTNSGAGSVGKPSTEYNATKVGGKFGAVKFQVEATEKNGSVSDTFIFVSYGMKMGNGKLIIQGGNADGDSYVDGVTDLTVGYIKKYNKKARLFGGLRSTSGDVDDTVITVGLRLDY